MPGKQLPSGDDMPTSLPRCGKKPSLGPWKLLWQTSPKGRKSRFEVQDANGRTVARLRREADAVLVVRALQMWKLLAHICDTARIWRLILSSEFNHTITEPSGRKSIEPSQDLLDEIRRALC